MVTEGNATGISIDPSQTAGSLGVPEPRCSCTASIGTSHKQVHCAMCRLPALLPAVETELKAPSPLHPERNTCVQAEYNTCLRARHNCGPRCPNWGSFCDSRMQLGVSPHFHLPLVVTSAFYSFRVLSDQNMSQLS